ncbi:MAG: PTS sugar transporter subunit IIB [Smithellaceae bacterium]|nr:PTS sugar transporter subunit IIB [Smithellaceae bacterium]
MKQTTADIVLVRVDNRLVHGQIIEAWVPHTKAARIVVADDSVADDFFRETVIRMAVPKGVEVNVFSVEEFARGHVYGVGNGKRTIVLFSTIADALEAYRLGFAFEKLNVGNVYSEACLKKCSSSVFLGREDICNIKRLLENKVEVELKRVPRDKPIDIKEAIKRIKC